MIQMICLNILNSILIDFMYDISIFNVTALKPNHKNLDEPNDCQYFLLQQPYVHGRVKGANPSRHRHNINSCVYCRIIVPRYNWVDVAHVVVDFVTRT